MMRIRSLVAAARRGVPRNQDPHEACACPNQYPLAGRSVVRRRVGVESAPILAIELVNQFRRESTNKNGAQIIFTTHDTNLLGNITTEAPPLRREQIWLTEKDKDGATELYPLSDYKPRKEENLERGYLQGRYGAIPFIGSLFPAKG